MLKGELSVCARSPGKQKEWETREISLSAVLGNGREAEVRLPAKLQLRENGSSLERKT